MLEKTKELKTKEKIPKKAHITKEEIEPIKETIEAMAKTESKEEITPTFIFNKKYLASYKNLNFDKKVDLKPIIPIYIQEKEFKASARYYFDKNILKTEDKKLIKITFNSPFKPSLKKGFITTIIKDNSDYAKINFKEKFKAHLITTSFNKNLPVSANLQLPILTPHEKFKAKIKKDFNTTLQISETKPDKAKEIIKISEESEFEAETENLDYL
ncbi:MAG: hypothetical protein ACE5KE_07585, partial [Methanosarcinales archaeon]